MNNRVYANKTEEDRRFAAFTENKLIISDHNAKYHRGHVSYKLRITSAADEVKLIAFNI